KDEPLPEKKCGWMGAEHLGEQRNPDKILDESAQSWQVVSVTRNVSSVPSQGEMGTLLVLG
ncbi:hypothetical protein L9G74_22070, partial [Shewanella sp. C32]|nr:hypothetical protein [Shewanella electrica]